MKDIIKFGFIALIGLLSSNYLNAQNQEEKYLVGAVPEIEGKVTFAKVIHLQGVSKEDIFENIVSWMNQYVENKDATSRVVYQNLDEGIAVTLATDTIVFKSTALSLDRTFVNFQLEARVSDEQCDLAMTKISYKYQQDEKYTAEEMISDGTALNKAKTKIYKGLQKWRIGTINFKDKLFDSATTSLSNLKATNRAEQSLIPLQPSISKQKLEPAKEYAAKTIQSNITEDSIYSILYNKKNIYILQIDNNPIKYNITNYFSGIGNFLGEERVYLTIPMSEEFYDMLEDSDNFNISIFKDGESTASIKLTCKKNIAQSIVPESIDNVTLRKELAKQPIHKLYINDIVDIVINK